MAIGGAGASDYLHFSADRFNPFLAAHGTPATWKKAIGCPCVDKTTGQSELDCLICDNGVLWESAGTEIVTLAPGRAKNELYDTAGLAMQGIVTLTFASTITPGHLDRIEMTAAEMVVNTDHFVRGAVNNLAKSRERLRFRDAFLRAEYVKTIESDIETTYLPTTDFTVSADGTVTWVTAGPPADERYTIRYIARPVYIIWAPQSRDENASKMPYRAQAQRLDFFARQVAA